LKGKDENKKKSEDSAVHDMAYNMMATIIIPLSSSEAVEEETEKEQQPKCEKKNIDKEDDADDIDVIGDGYSQSGRADGDDNINDTVDIDIAFVGNASDEQSELVREIIISGEEEEKVGDAIIVSIVEEEVDKNKNNNHKDDDDNNNDDNQQSSNFQQKKQQQQQSKKNYDDIFTGAYHTTNGLWEEEGDAEKEKKKLNNNKTQKEEEERRRCCDDHNSNNTHNENDDYNEKDYNTTTEDVPASEKKEMPSSPSPSAVAATAAAATDKSHYYECVKLNSTSIPVDTTVTVTAEKDNNDNESELIVCEEEEHDGNNASVAVEVEVEVVERNNDNKDNNISDDEQQLIKDATSYGAYVASCTNITNTNDNNSGSFDDDERGGGDGNTSEGEGGIEDSGSAIPMTPIAISDNNTNTNTNTSGSILKTPNTIPNLHHRLNRINNNSPDINDMINDIPILKSTPVSTTATLAAIFGDEKGVAGGLLTASATNNGDYILVGNSPYETTYDPRSSYFYNRVYGHLYITTKSILFRGKAFGPIGAIPYERRLILPLGEILRTEFYRTTSIRITMYDSEKYIFKSFESNTRKTILKLIQKTIKRREEEEQQQKRGRCMSYDDTTDAIIHDSNNDGAVDHSDNDSDSYAEGGRIEKQRSRSVPTFRSFNSRSTTTPTTSTTSMAVTTTIATPPPRLPSPRSFDDDDNDNNNDDHGGNDDDAHSQLVTSTPASMKCSSKIPIRNSTTHLRHRSGSRGTPVRSLRLSVGVGVGVEDDGDGDGDGDGDSNDDDKSYDVPLTGGTHENTDDTATTPAMTKTTQVQDMNNNNRNASAAAGDDDDDPVSQPRRLFGSTKNGASSVNSIATSMMMMSPPRMMISQRRLPKTPAGNIGPPVNTNNNNTNTISTSAAINNNGRSHQRQPLQLRHRSQRTATASIPTIPTVPSLNTPEPTKHLKKAIDIAMLNNIASRGIMGIPISISEIEVAAIASSKVTATENNLAVQRAWVERKTEGKSNNYDSEWKIALEMTVLEQCTLDDWFDLFFSDDAHFSLQNYQIKDIGDKDVKYDSWTKKKKKKSNEDGSNDHINAEDEGNNKENINDSIPELERNITFMHPISGNLMGPSEAETFRLQTLKRYGSYGAILTNITTVGSSVPMGDCFRVEDQWIIESAQSKLSNSTNNKNDKTNNDNYDSLSKEALTVTVKFRVVFVKRTMFKSIITKNVISETKKWFIGYEKMMKVGLKSKVHTQTIQKRRRSQEECISLSLPSSSNTMSAATISEEKNVYNTITEKEDDNLTVSTPSTAPVVVAANDEDEDVTFVTSRLSVLLDILGALVRGIIDMIRSLPMVVRSNIAGSWYGESTAAAVMMILLLAVLVLFQINYSSVRNSLTTIEEQLRDLHIQNAILLKRIEELSLVSLSSSSTATSATVQ
jgi:hypothetical protein